MASESEPKKKAKDSKEESKKTSQPPGGRELATVAVLLVAGLALALYLTSVGRPAPAAPPATTTVPQAPPPKTVVGEGDLVAVNYVGRLVNGTVFDTTYENAAREAGIYAAERSYSPLSFVVGSGQMIPGFERAVSGMRVGERKTVRISPAEAYGERNPEAIRVIARQYPIPRVDFIDKLRFEVYAKEDPQPGETVVDDDIPWPMYIVNVTNDTVAIRYEPTVGQSFETMFGNATILNVSDDEFWVEENPTKGGSVFTRAGPVVVRDYNETNVVLDFNYPLAGETLVFDIKVEGIIQQPALPQQQA